MGTNRKYDYDKIRELYLSGKSSVEIGDIMNIQSQTIRAAIKRMKEQGLIPKDYYPDKKGLNLKYRISAKNIHLSEREKEYIKIKEFVIAKKTARIGELSRLIDRSKETIIKYLDRMKQEGIDVFIDETTRSAIIPKIQRAKKDIKIKSLYKKTFKIGLISDTHLGSKYQQLSLLHSAYKHFEEEDVRFVVHAGDVFDGEHVYRGQEQETFLIGIDKAINYAYDNYPHSRKFKTYMAAGNHDEDYWKRAGFNPVRALAEKRKDIVYIDRFQTFKVKNFSFKVIHPKGGNAYAKSYKLQKHFQALLQDVITQLQIDKNALIPNMYITGHFHYFVEFDYANITGMSLPCFQAQTPHLRDLGLAPEIGYIILELSFDKNDHLVKIKKERIKLNHKIIKDDY